MSSSPDARRTRSAPFVDLDEQMAAVPLPNRAAEVVLDEPERMVLAVAKKYSAALRWAVPIFRLRTQQKYELTGPGLALFRRLDGEACVEDHVHWLCDEHALTFFEGRALIMQYMQMLIDRGLAVLALKKEDVAQAPGVVSADDASEEAESCDADTEDPAGGEDPPAGAC